MNASIDHESPQPQMPCTKFASSCAAAVGVHDLGMELDAVERPRLVAHGRERRVVARRDAFEAVGQPQHAIAVAHPDGALGRILEAGEERVARGVRASAGRGRTPDRRTLPRRRRAAGTSTGARSRRRAPERRDRAVRGARTARPASSTLAGPPDSTMPFGANARTALELDVAGMDLAVDAALADAARDELGELGAEVQDQDAIAVRIRGHQRGILAATRAGSWGLPS